ncbi:26_t:CDS:2 [Gigaspora margarita]|uniref:26_t:CDS:1 n=1 Tax=Gigaspora margarita TaxID=4874 RepID=A0ABN7WT78_GIGMA|nr:26_t:CDS:2 [Gigaspora margarita]
MTTKDNNNPFCCTLTTILQEIYYEQIHGKKYYSLGYYTTYYYLLKEYKKQNQLYKILQSEENEEEETTYTLTEEAKTKYSPPNEKELIEVLTNLLLSIDNLPYRSLSNSYSSLSEQDNNYHSLPDCSDLINQQVTKSTRATRLAKALSEEEVMGKFLLEAAISLNYDLIKRKEYNQLEESEQQQLTKPKEMVDKLLTALADEEANRSQNSS